MWMLVAMLILGAAASAAWLLAAAGVRVSRRLRGHESGWVSTAMRRSLVLTIACMLSATALHLGMTRIESVAPQMPVALLRLDVGRSEYGSIALESLCIRAEQHTLSHSAASAITDTLIDGDWWMEETTRQAFDPLRPAEKWLTIQMEQARLSEAQLARWLNLVPPPMFLAGADVRESPAPIALTALFGREWQRIGNVPYRVHRLEITEIRLNGEAQEFTLQEESDSNAEIGWYANRVAYRILGLLATADGSPRCEIEVVYFLDLEPSSYRRIGPLTWRTTLLVN